MTLTLAFDGVRIEVTFLLNTKISSSSQWSASVEH